jgi:hypothetical protein
MFVFVQDASESVASSDVELGYLVWVIDRGWQWVQGSGVREALVTVSVEVALVLAENRKGVLLDQHPACALGPCTGGRSVPRTRSLEAFSVEC